MKKSRILFVVVMVALQGFIACKSDEISPPSLSQQAENLVKENKLVKVKILPQSEPIIYLKSVEKASQFFLGLKSKLQSPPTNAQA